MWHHNKIPKYYTETKKEKISNSTSKWDEPLDTKESSDTEESTSLFDSIKTRFTQVYDLASETFYTPMEECAPCYIIVISISVLIIVTLIHTIALHSIGSSIKTIKKHMKRVVEGKPLKRETREKGLTTAALKPLKRRSSRARDRNRETLGYRLYPTKGINQVQTTLPTILPYYCRYPETDHLQTPCDDCRNQLQGLEIWQDAANPHPHKQTDKNKTPIPINITKTDTPQIKQKTIHSLLKRTLT